MPAGALDGAKAAILFSLSFKVLVYHVPHR
jgi:hypothetical protein